MRIRNFSVMLFILLLTGVVQFLYAQAVYAQGIIFTNAPRNTQLQSIKIEKHHVNVTIDNQLATTKIDQVFANPNNRQLEGTYIFPLTDEVAVSDFVLYINGKPVKAELLAKDRARSIYEGIVRSMQDPALLEYVGTRAFKARVFPIPPRGERRIQLEYSQVIKTDSGLARYTYPLRTDQFTQQPTGSLAVSIDIKSKHGLKTIYSPSHEVAVNRKDDKRANISYEGSNVQVLRDFACYYSLSDKDFGIDIITHREDVDEDGYFMLLISPKFTINKKEIVEKDFIFILDRSGSMKGKKIEQAKKALRFCINNLNDGDRFNLITFNTDVDPFSKSLDSVKKIREDALTFVDGIVANGGTNINGALQAALEEQPDPKRPRIIVFLTDGEATVGVTDTPNILKNVSAANNDKSRIFVFGVGYDVNVDLLDKMSAQNSGTRQYVKPEEDLEIAISSFYTKVSEPVLVNLDLDIRNIKLKDFYPKKLPHLFRGSQLTVLGRYVGKGETDLVLRGDINGKTHKFSNKTEFPRQQSDHQFMPRLWAQRKVAYLVDEIRLNGENKELSEEITRLSEKYGIMTPYTSFLVTEDGSRGRMLSERARLQQSGRSRSNQPIPLTATKVPSAAESNRKGQFSALRAPESKAAKVVSSLETQRLQKAEQLAITGAAIKHVKDKTFYLLDKVWVDSTHKKDTKTTKVEFASKTYFELIKKEPDLAKYLSVGKHVIICYKGTCYKIHPAKQTEERQ